MRKAANDNAKRAIIPQHLAMRHLWLAVMRTAIADGDEAWTYTDDFAEVASLAGLEPGYAAPIVRRAIGKRRVARRAAA